MVNIASIITAGIYTNSYKDLDRRHKHRQLSVKSRNHNLMSGRKGDHIRLSKWYRTCPALVEHVGDCKVSLTALSTVQNLNTAVLPLQLSIRSNVLLIQIKN